MQKLPVRRLSLTAKFCRPFHSRKPRKDVDLPDYLKTLDALDSKEWNEKHGCKYWDSFVVNFISRGSYSGVSLYNFID